MSIPLPVVAGSIAGAAAVVLRGAQQEALLSGPEYIRDAEPDGLIKRAGLAVARQACRRYADNPNGLLDIAAAQYEDSCRPYLDSLGYGSGLGLNQEFEGGQCSDIRYVANGTYVSNQENVGGCGATRECRSGAVFGPISGVTIAPGVQQGWLLQGGNSTAGWFDVETGLQLLDVPDCGPSVGGSSVRASRPTITSVETLFGEIDACGNPPPVVIDPVPPPETGPDDEPFKPTPDTTVNFNVTLNFDGTINFNMGLAVPIVINPFGGGDDGAGGGGDPDASPAAPEPGPTNPGDNGGFGGDDEFGEPPAGRRWVGACLTIVNKPANSGIIVGSQPEDVYPSVVGNVRLVFNAAGNRQTDTPVRITAKKVCVWEPVSKLNPTGINVDLLPGYGYTYTPYSVPSGD